MFGWTPARTHLPGDRRHLAAQLFKLFSAIILALIQGKRRCHRLPPAVPVHYRYRTFVRYHE
jgi:hypothetical protein